MFWKSDFDEFYEQENADKIRGSLYYFWYRDVLKETAVETEERFTLDRVEQEGFIEVS